jgi:acetolactate synthase-1/2/3 large subunit
MLLGSKILFNTLLQNNVKHVFGYSGGAILPILNEFYNQDKIKFIMSRTELGGSFMAEGYSKSTNKPGVVMTTSGPGAINIMTSLQNALSDGTPIMALCGQVSSKVLGTQAFQEADIVSISKKCTKWNSQIDNGNLINTTIDFGFQKMYSKRHGPVLIDLPKNIMSESFEYKKLNILKNVHNYDKKSSNITPEEINNLVIQSKRPIILAGNGVYQSNSFELIRKFSNFYKIPTTTTLLGLGTFNETDKLSLKMLGMHGSYYANKAVQESDLLINFGSRFDDRITGDPKTFAPKAKIVHIDILESNIGKVIKPHFYINDDCNKILSKLLETKKKREYNIKEWHEVINHWKIIDFSYPKNTYFLHARHVISTLNKIIHKDNTYNYTVIADVGAHQMWTAQFIDYNYPKIKFITSGGLGSMGFALPASIGVKIGNPKEKVICIVGDGGFTMSMVELLTAVDNNINIKVLIINNGAQQMVKMWQNMFYDSRIIGTDMNNPQFEKVAKSLGCAGIKIDNFNNLENKLSYILNYEEGPIVANIITIDDEPVLPMVSPGKALDDMIIYEDSYKQKFEGEVPC